MATATARRKYTYEDYLKFPDDLRCEIIDGEVYEWNRPDEDREAFLERLERALAGEPYDMTPSPRTKHQAITGNIFVELYAFVRKHELGRVYDAPMDVKLADGVIQPDILFISKERQSIITELNIQGAPDLVVEVLSPSTAKHDRQRKTQLYAKHGVREYWRVDPDVRLVERLELRDNSYVIAAVYGESDTLESGVLPGLKIKLDEVFAQR
jgi:Uma2 family endonuclease